jgi:hypothetical protein
VVQGTLYLKLKGCHLPEEKPGKKEMVRKLKETYDRMFW